MFAAISASASSTCQGCLYDASGCILLVGTWWL